MNALQREANRYLNARALLDDLRKYERYITYAKYRKLRKRALEGDVMGATKELGRIVLERREGINRVRKDDAKRGTDKGYHFRGYRKDDATQ